MKLLSVVATLLMLVVLATDSHAALRSIEKEYTYLASEADSKLSSRIVALEQVKRLILEEIGTFILSETEVKNSQLTKDQIVTYTAGVVATVIVDERWDGRNYFVKARLSVDPQDVAKSVEQLRRDKEKNSELELLRAEKTAALQEIEQLRLEMQKLKSSPPATSRAYLKAINKIEAADLIEKAANLRNDEKWAEAAEYYSRAIKVAPGIARFYASRGWMYYKLKKYSEALRDFDRTIELDPQYPYGYHNKGYVYVDYGDWKTALGLFRKSVEVSPGFARGYNGIGYAAFRMGEQKDSKKALDRAIELDPNFSRSFVNRGNYFLQRKEYLKALEDVNRGIELEPTFGRGYFFRAKVYEAVGEKEKAKDDYREAARLGDGKALKAMKKLGE